MLPLQIKDQSIDQSIKTHSVKCGSSYLICMDRKPGSCINQWMNIKDYIFAQIWDDKSSICGDFNVHLLKTEWTYFKIKLKVTVSLPLVTREGSAFILQFADPSHCAFSRLTHKGGKENRGKKRFCNIQLWEGSHRWLLINNMEPSHFCQINCVFVLLWFGDTYLFLVFGLKSFYQQHIFAQLLIVLLLLTLVGKAALTSNGGCLELEDLKQSCLRFS